LNTLVTPREEFATDTLFCWRALVALGSVSFAVAWTLWGGKVLHWDAVNYHFYLGFSALNDRFASDFLPAGTPSYLNPFAYVPLYVMERAGLPASVTAAALAAFHGLMLWLTFEIALLVCRAHPPTARVRFATLALVLAVLNPVLLQSLGLTLADLPLGVLVLCGWLALMRAIASGETKLVVVGGLLCGVASGLKPTNAAYAIAAISFLPFLQGCWRTRLQATAIYMAACGAGFLTAAAPWSIQLWNEFGNPLFPFLNGWFASPDFISVPTHYERYRPTTLVEFLLRPFEMLSPLARRHVEGHAPDLRYAAAFLLVGTLGVTRALLHARAHDRVGARPQPCTQIADRVLAALTIAFIIAWSLWLAASGNSRYFIPMGCIAAVLIAAVLDRLNRHWKDAATLIAGGLVLVQFTMIGIASDWQRDGVGWEGPLLRTEFPQRFRDEPYLFLSTSFLSGTAFLSHWHAESGMITVSGFYAIGPGKPGWERARAMIERNVDRLRILHLLPRDLDVARGLPSPPSELDIQIRRLGVRVDGDDCEFVRLESSLADLAREPGNEWTTFLTCRLVSAPEVADAYARDVVSVDAVFDRVEDACPNLFHPRRPVTEQLPKWARLYNLGSEIQLWMDNGRVWYRAPFLGGDAVDAGSVDAWRRAPQSIDCSKKTAPAFDGLLVERKVPKP
jgi:hypothetical protein